MDSLPYAVAPMELPPGHYTVVDLSDVFEGKAWETIVYKLLPSAGSPIFVADPHFAAPPAFVWSTMRGDGDYPLYFNVNGRRQFCVNINSLAGLLCLVSTALIEGDYIPGQYHIDTAETPVITPEGNMKHGAFEVINTGVIGPYDQTQPLSGLDTYGSNDRFLSSTPSMT